MFFFIVPIFVACIDTQEHNTSHTMLWMLYFLMLSISNVLCHLQMNYWEMRAAVYSRHILHIIFSSQLRVCSFVTTIILCLLRWVLFACYCLRNFYTCLSFYVLYLCVPICLFRTYMWLRTPTNYIVLLNMWHEPWVHMRLVLLTI